MIGNQDFVNGFSKNIPVYRYENNLDLVPFMAPSSAFIATLKSKATFIPPTLELDAIIGLCETEGGDGAWGYTPLGQLCFTDGNTVTNPAINPSAAAIASTLALGSSGLHQVANAHSHLCGAGYMNGTCNNSGVCPVGNY